MNYHRRINEGRERVAKRWQQADNAPRLSVEVPELESLRMQIEEFEQERPLAGSKYTRLIAVPNAPALFLVPCGDPRCSDGGHDLTYQIMSMLKHQAQQFDGEDSCYGSVGNLACNRTVRYAVTAAFKKA